MSRYFKKHNIDQSFREMLLLALMLLLLLSMLLSALGCGKDNASTSAVTTAPLSVTISTPKQTTTAIITPAPVTTMTAPVVTTGPVTTPVPVTTTTPVTTTPPPTTTTKPETTLPPATDNDGYKIDMSKYWDAVDPKGDLWDDAYLLLVNAANPVERGAESQYDVLKGRITFGESKDYKYSWRTDLYMNETAMKALSAMFNEAAADGVKYLDITSGYRSYDKQVSLFNNNCNKTFHWLCTEEFCGADWIGKSSTCPLCGAKATATLPITREEIEENVATYSCAPGTSDHQTGLAVDIVQTSLPSRFDSLIQEFGETEAGKWLAENCYRFGFVLRFPEDKQDQTGIIYEPWHFRFVGLTHATAMYDMNLCLEEYVEYLTSVGYFE